VSSEFIYLDNSRHYNWKFLRNKIQNNKSGTFNLGSSTLKNITRNIIFSLQRYLTRVWEKQQITLSVFTYLTQLVKSEKRTITRARVIEVC